MIENCVVCQKYLPTIALQEQGMCNMCDDKTSAVSRKQLILDDIDYLYGRINWKDSFLDAKAVMIMNELKERIFKL